MKREIKAALGVVVVLLGALLLWLAQGPEASPSSSAESPREPDARSTRVAAPSPGEEALVPPAPQTSPQGGASSAAPAGIAPPVLQPSPVSRASEEVPARLDGIVISPAGSPVVTKVFAFEVGPRVNPSYAYFGRGTPPEVRALARRLSEGRANLVAETESDAAGGFSFSGQDRAGFELLLVAAAPEGVGGVRVRPGALDPLLTLERRRALRVQIVSQEDLEQARLELVYGRSDALEFPALDPQGVTRLEVLVTPPSSTRLRLQRPGWLPLERLLSAAEHERGAVTWVLPTDLAEIRGRVHGPSGEPWVGGEVLLSFREPDPERWRHLTLRTDSEGEFDGRGFPAGQRVRVQVAGTAAHAFHFEHVRAGGPPLSLRLQPPSALRVRVERFAGDVDAIEAEWKLERQVGQAWEEVDFFLFGRPPQRFTASEGELERRFGLRVGLNEILGLPPGRYRVSLAGFDGNVAESVEVELEPRGATTCELGLQKRRPVVFKIQLASSGPSLGGRKVRVSYSEGPAEVLRTPTLDAQGQLTLEARFAGPIEAQISVPELRLGATVTLDPSAPDLGTVLLRAD